MLKQLLFTVVCAVGVARVVAQDNANVYRNAANVYYWKNRMPDKAYWQQDVAYTINAKIDETDHKIEATEQIEYCNNSPDTLRFVYFHLYQNAFVKGSYLHKLEKANNVRTRMGKKEAAGIGTEILEMKVNGMTATTELDNTILKVYLHQPLAPGGKVVLGTKFVTHYDKGATRRRMQMYNAWGFTHYNGCQWYPKLAVYDRMHGWDTYQHLNKEFYGDYGVFDVTLDFPSNYIVEASGELKNRNEVLPVDLRAKLDIKNFATKKATDTPTTIIPYVKGERKKWHFVANNVHDFAFTADPSYRIGTAYWNGVECVAIAQEPHAAGWQNAADYMTKIIKTFSEEIGMYCYPKIVAADANDGMEYPMITLDGGSDPGYRGLLVHEIGHNWFYGQVGSNETYRAAMDEGFTQYLTALGLRKIDGDTVMAAKPKGFWRKTFAEDPQLVIDRNLLNSYTMTALNGNEVPLNTHSDDFNSALNHGGGYGMVYHKTASMLYNLEYVLGDSLFKAAMHNYFEQWKFAHPYFEDFRASIINFTHVDLSWFFDQWFETTKVLDYGIGSIRRAGNGDWKVTFKRKREMQMPLDFTVTDKKGNKTHYYIPNTWYTKSTTAQVLPKWTGWGKLNPTYTATIHVPDGVKKVQIDTTYRFADADYTDNIKTKHPLFNAPNICTKLDGGLAVNTNRRKYKLYARPDLWWNPVDGMKLGVHFEGDYMFSKNKLDATIWWNSHILQEDAYLPYEDQTTYYRYEPINYSINYSTPVARNMPKLQMQLNSRYLDGGWYHRLGLNWQVSENDLLQVYGLSMWRGSYSAKDYLTDPNNWTSTWERHNTSINLGYTHSYNYLRGAGRYTINIRTPLLTGKNSGVDYSFIQLESVNNTAIAKFDLRTRFFARFGVGSSFANESLLYLAGASPEEQMENKYTRSKGYIPYDWQGYSLYDVNHFQQGGGLNLRGYAGYVAVDERGTTTYSAYKGRSGAAVNMELGFDNYLTLRPRLTRNWLHVSPYLFADAGVIELSSYNPSDIYTLNPTVYCSDLRVDAGLGVAFTIKKWGVFEKAKPLTLRFDMPFFVNRAPYSNAQYATFRYVIGINRAF